ncbi:multidrug effflux MFS transporter [Advenella mimigardefordensis]|uniref:Bcr/CflA family efflux transporter n=1 Tax=Advenella mimigardefordensis (strain DSM 17166 / LMG 22922 / DPN7) TaxID=1247726 RepID=W0PG09_ADVMD|nr:multidrug effflux MFS transporter [Advenella mimigardefordensis]AHG64008.1 putative MFS-type drug resistance transporter, Bcr/CflA subfamily [Advenella mimigardefordensis DPN7]
MQKNKAIRAPLWLLVLVTLSGTLAMHMFVPALPDAATDLHASMGAMQMTISLYILGLAFGQLVYGPLSDGFGRRPLLLAGLSIYAVAGVAAAFAQNESTLVGARLFQALGGCAGLALGRAIVRDTAAGDSAVKDQALLNLIMMAGPGLAPLLGSFLALHFGWRAVFYVLVLLGVITLLSTWKLLPETGRPTGKVRPAVLAADYTSLLRSPSFLGYALGGGCATTAIYAFIAAAPFVITMDLHRPANEVGLYLALLIVGMSVGNAATRQLIGRYSLERLLIGGNAISVVAALLLLTLTLADQLHIISVTALMFVFSMGAGMASPAALTKGLNVDRHLVGSAAGLYGFTQMSVGAICTSLVGLGDNPALTAFTVLACTAILGQAGLWFGMKQDRRMAHNVLASDATTNHH